MKFFNLKNLMASGRQCGVAFIIAAVVHGFLTTGPAAEAMVTGPAVEAMVTGAVGFALVIIGSFQPPGGNPQ